MMTLVSLILSAILIFVLSYHIIGVLTSHYVQSSLLRSCISKFKSLALLKFSDTLIECLEKGLNIKHLRIRELLLIDISMIILMMVCIININGSLLSINLFKSIYITGIFMFITFVISILSIVKRVIVLCGIMIYVDVAMLLLVMDSALGDFRQSLIFAAACYWFFSSRLVSLKNIGRFYNQVSHS